MVNPTNTEMKIIERMIQHMRKEGLTVDQAVAYFENIYSEKLIMYFLLVCGK